MLIGYDGFPFKGYGPPSVRAKPGALILHRYCLDTIHIESMVAFGTGTLSLTVPKSSSYIQPSGQGITRSHEIFTQTLAFYL